MFLWIIYFNITTDVMHVIDVKFMNFIFFFKRMVPFRSRYENNVEMVSV